MGHKPYSDDEYQRYFSERAKRDLMEKRYQGEKQRRVAEVGERAKLEATGSRLSFLIVIQVLMLMLILGEGYATHGNYNRSAGIDVLVLVSMLGTMIVFPWILLELLRYGTVSARVKAVAANARGIATSVPTRPRKKWVGYGIAIIVVAIAIAFGYALLAGT